MPGAICTRDPAPKVGDVVEVKWEILEIFAKAKIDKINHFSFYYIVVHD